jgi:hypothetical protein
MNEPKRRGRPPKAKPEPKVEGAMAVGCVACGQTGGHYDDCPVGLGVMESKDVVLMEEALGINPAQAYANRVWKGQSPDVPRAERLERVKRALDGQGLSMEGVVL